ncbi:hypothetical protein [Marivita sp. S0852]|uniref:hypothetical protein n=1 Tax=Marivita sp. S0852 TaxID=3373893 RepID=UPI00398234FD
MSICTLTVWCVKSGLRGILDKLIDPGCETGSHVAICAIGASAEKGFFSRVFL